MLAERPGWWPPAGPGQSFSTVSSTCPSLPHLSSSWPYPQAPCLCRWQATEKSVNQSGDWPLRGKLESAVETSGLKYYVFIEKLKVKILNRKNFSFFLIIRLGTTESPKNKIIEKNTVDLRSDLSSSIILTPRIYRLTDSPVIGYSKTHYAERWPLVERCLLCFAQKIPHWNW